MTSQSRADALLAAWQQLRAQGMSPELRLPVIDALCEIERAGRTPHEARPAPQGQLLQNVDHI